MNIINSKITGFDDLGSRNARREVKHALAFITGVRK